MTSYQTIYDAFLAKINADDWSDMPEEMAEQDWRAILEAALPWFKFPRTSLAHDDTGFSGDLSYEEIQIIANYMKCEWLNRCIMTWDNIRVLYDERDFSQANLLDKLNLTLVQEKDNARALEAIYYRSRNGKPFEYSKLGTSS